MKKFISVLCFLFLSIFISNYSFTEAAESIDADSLQQTTVTPYLQKKITAGKNLVYGATFQLAWNALCDDIIKVPLQLSGTSEIQNMLNERLVNKEDIAENTCIAMAGFERNNIVQKIDEALLKKFNNTKGCGIKLHNPSDILAYAYLFKNLEFENKFEDLNSNPIFFKNETEVETFGIKQYSYEIAKQVKILYYNNDNDFILKLESKSQNDEIILAKIEPKEMLLTTVDYVFEQIKNKKTIALKKGDILKIPKFDFDIFKKYRELTGRSYGVYALAGAIQGIKFKLDEKGVILESYAAIVMQEKSISVPVEPKQLIFDKPFLFCLKEKNGKYPYFVMWIDNAELMLKK